MSPLLGSTGGSSEYAYRGTLDDWPNPFATALSAQNIIGTQSPTVSATAILTVTGLNYKARVTVENDNATLSIDGGVTYVPARSTDAAVFTRDNNTIRIRLQPTSGTLSDFNKSYTIPVKIGKRQGTWTVSTRAIDETPNPFIFNGLIDQQLGVTTVSSSSTIAGLETGFSFPISVSANQTGDGTTINIYKNGSLIGVSGTVANNDQIYLSTQTPNSYNTTRTFNVQVGTFTTTWGLITRNAITTIDPFSFTGISSANQLGFGYTSGFMTVNGADAGPAVADPNTWPGDPAALLVSTTGIGSFQIVKSDGSLRYRDPANLSAPTYFQTGSISTTRYAFNGDKINVKLPSSASYNTTTTTTLSVSDKSAAFIVTTRPAPIDSIPQDLNNTFTDAPNQGRGVVVTSGIVTLTNMIAGSIGTASIPSATAGVSPQFNINGSATWISSPTTANVQNGDTIRLRMTTPVVNTANGVTNNTLTFRVNGVDTQGNNPTPTDNPEGYTTATGFQEDIWNVSTIARTCSITPFSVTNISGASLNSAQFINFTVDGYNSDCQMNVTVTSTSDDYNFTQLNGSGITTAKTLTNVAAGSTVTLLVRSSPSYVTGVASTITVSNSASGVTPLSGFNTSFTVTTVADDTPWELFLSASPTTIGIGDAVTLTWSSTNCTSIRSVTWSATPPTNLNGSTIQTPTSTGSYIATITAYVNPASSTRDVGTTVEGSNWYATRVATVTVNEDYIPTLTPSAVIFSSITNAEPSSLLANQVSSGSLTVTGISAPISGIVTGSSGAVFVLPTPNTTINSNIANNATIQLRVNASGDFLTTTSAFLELTDPVGNPVASKREFRVTTRECIPTESVIQWPVGILANFVTLTYYTEAQFTNTANTVISGEILLKSRPPTGLVATGTATAYYNSILAGSGNFQGSTATISWAELITAIWDSFTLNAQRPPAQFEIEALLGAFVPSSYTGITAGATPWQTVLDSAATSNTSRIRNTASPILNSCFTRAATVGTIKTGAY
jgi:hypothetical protein